MYGTVYDSILKLTKLRLRIGSSIAKSSDGVMLFSVEAIAGYNSKHPSGTRQFFWIARLIMPQARLPPAESPEITIFLNLIFRYFSDL